MFGKKKKEEKKEKKSVLGTEKLVLGTENYKMSDEFDSMKLYVGNLEYISSTPTSFGPKCERTEQKYLFEKIEEDGKVKYREIFTGFLADKDQGSYFDLPYVVNVERLVDVYPNVWGKIHKYACLLILDEVNKEKGKERVKK